MDMITIGYDSMAQLEATFAALGDAPQGHPKRLAQGEALGQRARGTFSMSQTALSSNLRS